MKGDISKRVGRENDSREENRRKALYINIKKKTHRRRLGPGEEI